MKSLFKVIAMILFACCLFYIINTTLTKSEKNKKFVIGAHYKAGFFSAFFGVLNNLLYAEQNNKIPVVFWNKESLYYQKLGYNGNFNVWEYYFEPVSELNYEDKDIIYYNYFSPNNDYKYCYYDIEYDYNACKINRLLLNKIIKKYIKIKPSIQNKIDLFFEQNMQNKLNIGIHLRGTDKETEYPKNDFEEIFKEANELSEKIKANYKQECQFFIATDEERLIEIARKSLNRNIIFYNSIRSKNGQAIHMNDENENKAILGEQVLIDVLLLSKCNYFLHNASSNVGMAVLCFNPNIKSILFDSNKKTLHKIKIFFINCFNRIKQICT